MLLLNTITIAHIRSLTPSELDDLAKESVRLQKDAKAATDANKSSFPAVGKVLCGLEERLNKLKAQVLIASNTSLASYFESITTKKPNNHAMSCAVAFGAYVRTGLVPEAQFDKNPCSNLELAASIATSCGGSVVNEYVKAAAAELLDRSKNSPGNLRALLLKVKPKESMDVLKALEKSNEIIDDGHIEALLAAVDAWFTTDASKELDAEKRKKVFTLLNACTDKVGTFEEQSAWVRENAAKAATAAKAAAKAAKPITVITEPGPVETAPVETAPVEAPVAESEPETALAETTEEEPQLEEQAA